MGDIPVIYFEFEPGPKIIKRFQKTQLSMKFQLLIKTKISKNKDFSCFQTIQCCIYLANTS